MDLKTYSYESIEQLEAEIEQTKDLQRNGKLRRRTMTKMATKLPRLRQRLAKLKIGHEKLAKLMRADVQNLEQLPKEMRLAILEKIYTHSEQIIIMSRRIAAKHHFVLPDDESMYLSSAHVGPTIALEANEIFYKLNCFKFSLSAMAGDRGGVDWMKQFFDTDHYHSGIRPREILRKVSISLDSPLNTFAIGSEDRPPGHGTFESSYEVALNSERNAVWPRFPCARIALQQIVNGLPNLRELAIDTDRMDSEASMMRLINPVVRHALDGGIDTHVTARVWVPWEPENVKKEVDIISRFARPSDTDLAVFKRESQRESFRIGDDAHDPLDVWWKLQNNAKGTPTLCFGDAQTPSEVNVRESCLRVWLNEHFEYWEWRQAHRQFIKPFEEMRAEIAAATPESLPHRLRYYVRLLTLMHPAIDGQ